LKEDLGKVTNQLTELKADGSAAKPNKAAAPAADLLSFDSPAKPGLVITTTHCCCVTRV
jgi:hypothetical protein